MSCKVDCKDHTPEQREAIDKFEKLILTNVQEAESSQNSEEARKLIFGFEKASSEDQMSRWTRKDASYYGRDKTIMRRDLAECDVCKQERTCLGFDHSDDEYGAIWICEDCAHIAFTDGPQRLYDPPPTSCTHEECKSEGKE